MLSKKGEAFIDNLRMYLMVSGKNEREIKELIQELKEHLTEVEKSGRSIDEIIDQTPEQYMISLKNEMKTDYKHVFKLLPIYFLGVIAYFLMGPAIRGEFELNIIQVIGFPFAAGAGLIIYVYFLQQAGKKQYTFKILFFGGMIASMTVTFMILMLLLVSKFFVAPFFIGDVTSDLIVIFICSAIFIITSIWSKTWVSIWLPAILFIPDVYSRFTDSSVEKVLVVQMISFVLLFAILLIHLWFMNRKKRVEA
ncbi:hypothetical protein FZW96_14485 [Bacillus sp. BGMRC 2118]|nr:hypothetical protein FZW96_14485 [Bacillus sp. BGMRC 2118]